MCLAKALRMSTRSICFCGKIRKTINTFWLKKKTTTKNNFIWSYGSPYYLVQASKLLRVYTVHWMDYKNSEICARTTKTLTNLFTCKGLLGLSLFTYGKKKFDWQDSLYCCFHIIALDKVFYISAKKCWYFSYFFFSTKTYSTSPWKHTLWYLLTLVMLNKLLCHTHF